MAENYEDKALEIEAEETEVLKSLLNKQKKQLFYSRIAGLSLLLIAATIVILCLIIVPKVVNTLNQVDDLLVDTQQMVVELDKTLEQANGMIDEISSAASGVNSLVEDNQELLTESVTKMNSIDFEGLNTAIGDLEAIVEPMARLFGKR